MIFSNPSEASIVVKLEAATPAGNERPAILPSSSRRFWRLKPGVKRT
jgi:hypothetical protein